MKVRIGPYRKNRAQHVEIEPHDTWSMDHTLAMIIHPMLVQLKETTHGYPNELTEERWNEILDEMIWAFEQKLRDDWEGDYYEYREIGPEESKDRPESLFGVELVWEDREGQIAHQERMTNGFRLFGKYYDSMWN